MKSIRDELMKIYEENHPIDDEAHGPCHKHKSTYYESI